MAHVLPLSVWSVVEPVRILEFRQSMNLTVFFTGFSPPVSGATHVLLPTTLSDLRAQERGQNRLQRAALTQGNLRKELRVGKDVVPVTGSPVDARPLQGLPLREDKDSRTKKYTYA